MPNYYIGVDESGQAYIEHKRDTKYFMKIGRWPNARYFYSQEEYAAWLANQRDAKAQAAQRKNHRQIHHGKEVITNGRKGKARKIFGKRYNADGSLTDVGRKDAQAAADSYRAASQYAGVAQLFGGGYKRRK